MKQMTLTGYMLLVIRQLLEENRLGTAHVYQSTLRRVLSFTGGRPLHFHELTVAWLKGFQAHLRESQLSWNTVSTYMRMLRAAYFRAVDEGYAPCHLRLFKSVYTGTRTVVKRAVGEEVLRRVAGQPSVCPQLEEARLMFQLLFLLRGIPFVDLAFLRPSDLQGNLLSYRRRKTGSWITVRIEPEAMEILHRLANHDASCKYLFPIIRCPGTDEYRQYQNALRSFNYRLARLSASLGSNVRLSSYSARHSWATIANFHHYHQELICNAMGHSSVKVTETYFKVHADESIHQMNREIMQQVFVWEERKA